VGYALTAVRLPSPSSLPPDMSLLPEFKAELKQDSLNFGRPSTIEQAIPKRDVILVEPVFSPTIPSRDERKGDRRYHPANYKITRELLESKAKSDAILLHSLRRMDEIHPT